LPFRRAACRATVGGRDGNRQSVGRIDQHRHTVGEVEAAADNQADACGLRRLVGPDDAGERIPVHHGQRFDPGERRLGEQLLTGRRPPQKAEMRGDLKLGVAGLAHPKTPWMNQRCEPVAVSSPSPARNSQ